METYIWQRPQWPNLTWDDARTAAPLAAVNTLRGVLLGRLSLMGIGEQDEHMLDSLTREVIHSSEIEGEELNRDSVRSSLARHLGIDIEGGRSAGYELVY